MTWRRCDEKIKWTVPLRFAGTTKKYFPPLVLVVRLQKQPPAVFILVPTSNSGSLLPTEQRTIADYIINHKNKGCWCVCPTWNTVPTWSHHKHSLLQWNYVSITKTSSVLNLNYNYHVHTGVTTNTVPHPYVGVTFKAFPSCKGWVVTTTIIFNVLFSSLNDVCIFSVSVLGEMVRGSSRC